MQQKPKVTANYNTSLVKGNYNLLVNVVEVYTPTIVTPKGPGGLRLCIVGNIEVLKRLSIERTSPDKRKMDISGDVRYWHVEKYKNVGKTEFKTLVDLVNKTPTYIWDSAIHLDSLEKRNRAGYRFESGLLGRYIGSPGLR